MAEQIQEREFRQRRMIVPTIFMVLGIMFLAFSAFIIVFRVGQEPGLGTITSSIGNGGSSTSIPELATALSALAAPAIPIGLMLFFIGLVHRTRKHSLRWLRISVTTLCAILLGLAVLWALLVILLLISGF